MGQPNLVYILADDMGYGDVSCLNADSKIRTENLDRLAARGMRFRDAHSSSAVCTPSRYSILTGRYNWRSVLKSGVTGGYSRPILEDGRMTVASMLRDAGYTTACVGKWHLGIEWPLKNGGLASTYQDESQVDFTRPIGNGPCDHGFDTYFGISASLDMPPYVYIQNDRATAVPERIMDARDTGMDFMRAGWIAPDFVPEEVLPTLTDKAVEVIDHCAASDQPFFLYFALPAPHTPILPTPEFQGKSGTNAYGDFCLQVDDTVGRVMAALDRGGLADNTIVVFTTDNGCSPRADIEGLQKMDHYPSYVFRGHKADIYEGGHRIPLIVRWPGEIAPDSASDQTVCLGDLMATMAEVAGADLPDSAAEDCVSNLGIWRGERPEGEPLRASTVHHSIDGSFSLRRGKWKLEMCPGSGGWSDPRPGPACEGLPAVQLYDLEADISERENVEHLHPEVVAELREELTRIVRDGRSTPGAPQENTGPSWWEQLWWMREDATK